MFELSKLNYEFSDLEPFFDAQTMEIHYTKHHKTYLDKLNSTLEKFPEFFSKSIEDILSNLENLPIEIQLAVRNFGGGFFNHNIFWKSLKLGTEISPEVHFEIKKDFGSFDNFREEFTNKSLSLFGSGWVFLFRSNDGSLKIGQFANQDNPLVEKSGTPIFGLDLWEHAYYLKFQNRRNEFVENFWSVLNWDFVSEKILE
ncbi:MAG: superoxide dismutase [Mn] [Patescibacteria group bacterium]